MSSHFAGLAIALRGPPLGLNGHRINRLPLPFCVPADHLRTDLMGIAAETALKAMKVIEEKIRDWTCNLDVENTMLNGLENLLYSVKGRYDLALKPAGMDGASCGWRSRGTCLS
jgi:hypothetical protein